MKTFKPAIERTVLDVSVVIVLDDKQDFIMCGEIINGNVLLRSIDVTYHQKKEYDLLNDATKKDIVALAYEKFRELTLTE